MIEAIACAKVNLSLRIGAVQEDGLHLVGGLFQSISWTDRLSIGWAEEDELTSADGGPVVAGNNNLAWRAVELVRSQTGSARPVRVVLGKSIPAAAGLGGGSADGAAALAVMGRMLGAEVTTEMAARLGSDVPFCLHGGAAAVGGTGAALRARAVPSGFVLGLVVPPVELSTAAVFAQWDTMGGPTGRPMPEADLPPALRGDEALVNDLQPAAVALAPVLDEWRGELAARWGRPVLLTGSGPTLFGFFLDESEAQDALAAVPAGARGTAVAEPVPFGWVGRDDSAMWSYGHLDVPARELAASLFDG